MMTYMADKFDRSILKQIVLPKKGSHKGENGRVLVIGGSKLFHASIFWSADMASKVVDLVHFTSPAEENNELVRVKMKSKLWGGIVVPWGEVDEYIREDDCVLIGPGMPRKEGLQDGERETGEIVNELLVKYPKKRWVMDGGALQEMDPKLLNEKMIVTPHAGEFERLFGEKVESDVERRISQVEGMVRKHKGVTILLKGDVDVVSDGGKTILVEGGNEGMTKGGTGDVLAGLVTALYAKSSAYVSAVVASHVLKRAGEVIYGRVGMFFNAGDLVEEVPGVLAAELMIK